LKAVGGVLLICVLSACVAEPSAGEVRAPIARAEQARCQVAASQENPLVTEWASSEKANLEGRLASGAVAVAYSGCSMQLLPACRLPGSYIWRRTTISTDTVEILSSDELFAKLPLGAATLEGELERTGRLAVQTTVAGQLELNEFDARVAERDPSCRGATHVVGALSVGAFKLRTGGAISGRAGVGAVGAGAGRAEMVMREAGSPDACKAATAEAPDLNCRSPIQMFLRPLAPPSHEERAPPGQIQVRFLPPDEREWDLVVGDRKLCGTPCDRWTDPDMPYAFRTEGGFLRADPIEDVPDLREFAAQAPLEVRTKPRNMGMTAGGIVSTSIGGVAMIVGTVLLATGCGGQDTGRCVGGAITLPIGGLLVAGGVWYIVKARSRVEVAPMQNPGAWTPASERP
jgi:transposase